MLACCVPCRKWGRAAHSRHAGDLRRSPLADFAAKPENQNYCVRRMNGLLVRVGIDQTRGTGDWNGPVNPQSNEFVYVAINEAFEVHPGMERPFVDLVTSLSVLGVDLPGSLKSAHMHLDPDFEFLTYGDVRERAKQVSRMERGDLVVFYAGLRGIHNEPRLIYAIIGILVIDGIGLRSDVPMKHYRRNAHTRRLKGTANPEIVITGKPGLSGRLKTCIPIGSYRNRAYRVKPDLLRAWGGLSVKDGYLQRSARLPKFTDALQFYRWFKSMKRPLLARNN